MVVCPVCEHQQAEGDECQLCGRKLAGPGVRPLPVEPLPELEATALGGAEAVAVAPIPDLELTHHRPAAAESAPVPDLEPTRAAPVRVSAEAVADLEPTRAEAIPGDGPTPRPATLLCRYCRSENPPGETSCLRCGMRLPAWEGPVASPPAGGMGLARCPACGTQNAGEICTGCGGLVRHR